MKWRRCIGAVAGAWLAITTSGPAHAAESLSSEVRQLIVSIAPTWESPRGRLQCFERDGERWRAVSRVFPALYGAGGLAWGRGALDDETAALQKREGDRRAPAGVFALGKIYGYAAALPAGAVYPYHQVTEADAWIDDPAHPQYNRHIVVDPQNPPSWFEKQRMRLGDAAYRWMIEVRHNADPPSPGAGSAIFLHVRRGENRLTAGCTTLAEDDLLWLIRWLRGEQRPHFALLPKAEYERRREAWGLPELTAELAGM